MGGNGKLLDANGDGNPGGTRTADFTMLPFARIEGTNLFGFVRDSYTGVPIVGATIRVDSFAEANDVTDANGRFELVDMPAPRLLRACEWLDGHQRIGRFRLSQCWQAVPQCPGQRSAAKHEKEALNVPYPATQRRAENTNN